jgi:hypothetical protein
MAGQAGAARPEGAVFAMACTPGFSSIETVMTLGATGAFDSHRQSLMQAMN